MKNIKLFQVFVHSHQIYVIPIGKNDFITSCLIFDRETIQITEGPATVKFEGSYKGDKTISYFLGVFRTYGRHFLVVVEDCTLVAKIIDQLVYRIDSIAYIPIENFNPNNNREIIDSLTNQKKLLLQGFYFSLHGDITQSRQYQKSEDSFCWNYQLLRPFRENHLSQQWDLPIIQGYVEYMESQVNNNVKFQIILISRRSRFMGGTRYNSRGLNDDGHVANFIETEQIMILDGYLFSFVQIRGSVPVFWAQDSNITGCKLTRSKELTTTAFIKHFNLLKRYGQIKCVNLMQKSKTFEQLLTDNFEYQINQTGLEHVKYEFVDFHQNVKGGKSNGLNPYIYNYLKQLDNFQFYIEHNKEVRNKQTGTFRLNCLDCLDRTNLYMSKIGLVVLNTWLVIMNSNFCPTTSILDQFDENNKKLINDVVIKFKNIWANNGDMLSKLYSGSGSTVSEMTREGKRSIMGMFSESIRTIERLYNSTFEDETKQNAIDQLLQGYAQVLNSQDQWLKSQENRFCNTNQFSIYIVSWNVGGKEPTRRDFMDTLLNMEQQNLPDIIVFGLQEMVDLNPQNIMIMSNEKMKSLWDSIFQQNLDKLDKYVKLCEANLVGILSIVYIKQSQTPRVSQIEFDTVKTGLGGTLGNKGAATIKFKIDDTSIGLICCHLTSGNKQVTERLSDIEEIHQKAFQNLKSNHSLMSLDYSFLFGDTNFRIDGTYIDIVNKIRKYQQLIAKEANCPQAKRLLSELLAQDQLGKIKNNNQFLQNYQEGGINFLPTYKYDPQSEIYDTSKKQRIPSWCDRILVYCKEEFIYQQVFYTRRECMQSDHRPVVSYYLIEVKKMNKSKMELVRSEYNNKQQLGKDIHQEQQQQQQEQQLQWQQTQQVQQQYIIQPEIQEQYFIEQVQNNNSKQIPQKQAEELDLL